MRRWYKTKTNVKMRCILRARFYEMVKKEFKSKSVLKLIGCTVEELKVYIQKQFREGMSWENWGKQGWELDHIKPISKFDLTQEEEQKKCFHYTNMQPLWSLENSIKNNK